jgi:signal transduction histidine kinase
MLSVLLRNLVDNAIRYTPAAGEVSVAVERIDGAVRLSVSDNGPGIPPAERDRVGERFYRILGSDESGSGLGLSIVKRIAELHRATVSLGAGDGGRGLRASVIFPATG